MRIIKDLAGYSVKIVSPMVFGDGKRLEPQEITGDISTDASGKRFTMEAVVDGEKRTVTLNPECIGFYRL